MSVAALAMRRKLHTWAGIAERLGFDSPAAARRSTIRVWAELDESAEGLSGNEEPEA